MSHTFELSYGPVKVGTITRAFCSDNTWYGRFHPAIHDRLAGLQQQLWEFIQFSESWNERAEQGKEAHAAEFDRYSDLLTSGQWFIEDPDGKVFRIREAPVFSKDGELSWITAP